MLVAFLAAMLSGAAQGAAAVDRSAVDGLVAKVLADWKQPGLALAILEDGRVAYVRGYGVRRIGRPETVDADTLFGIGSCSKSFAAATAAELVDRGRLSFDRPVIDYAPWFKASDAWVTRQLTVRDILSHRSGLKAVMPRRAAPDRITYLRSLAASPAAFGLRDRYGYANDAVTLAGEVVSEVVGESWSDFARDALWRPLGMARTNADHRAATSDPDSASPHMPHDGAQVAVPWIYEDDVATPSGGVNSSARDLSHWLEFQLHHGAYGGRTLISAATFDEMHAPQTPVRGPEGSTPFSRIVGRGPEGVSFESYGMGWFTHVYRGARIVYHPGGIDGFKCLMGMAPDRGFGVVVLVNGENALLPYAVFQALLDRELKTVGDVDWSARFLAAQRAAERREAQEDARLDAAAAPDARARLPSSAYVGVFSDPAFGLVEIKESGGRLVARTGRLTFDLRSRGGDAFEFKLRWPYPVEDRVFATFVADAHGDLATLDFNGAVLKRSPDPAP